ncbi:MAG: LysR family transcriptional regulator [Neisseriaceae bacterium]|nr:LysR family transcriptional regulator [Neisseriaceae bacterium]MBP6861184.1 LysR family transcriptional regulator [Neisseriaceae bacterium]
MAFNQHLALSIFKSVAQQQSFTRAAVELSLSASAVSQSIRQLEAELGTRLFNRTTRSVSLTEAGTLLLAKIAPLLADMAEVLDSVKASPQSLQGMLKLSMPYVVWQALVSPMLPAFTQAYPDIELSIEISDALVDIVEQGFDAGIRLQQQLHQNMVAVPLDLEFKSLLVASPDYLRAHSMPQAPADLAQHRCIGYRFHSQGTVHPWRLKAAAGTDMIQFTPASLLLSEEHGLIESAQAGLGIAEVFQLGVAPALASGQLVPVLGAWLSPSQRFCLYYPSRQYLSMRLQAFIAMLKQQVALVARKDRDALEPA